MKRFLLTALLCLLAFNSYALNLPKENRVPGGVAILPLEGLNSIERPSAFYKSQRVMVVSSQGTQYAAKAKWLAIAGIPLSAKASTKQHLRANATSFYFSIKDKAYKSQYLKVKNKRHVNPDPNDLKRWKREKAEMVQAFKSWSTPLIPVTKLSLPAKGPFSSPFGLKRFFNNQPRNPHSGLDIAAPVGAPINSPAPGKVVAVGHYFFNGKTVIIDHGYGLTSMYCHMSKIAVKLGQQVKQGDSLGKIGKTGRVTGPHLHWSISLNNTRVDPLLFVRN